MNALDILNALDLPKNSVVDKRIPKTVLIKNGAPTSADKRRINDGIEEMRWLYELKPTTVGISEYMDDVREYLEIAVIQADYRLKAKTNRLNELLHRAIPYPVFLISLHKKTLTISLAHKRWSQGEVGATVLDGDLIHINLDTKLDNEIIDDFLNTLPLKSQPQGNLYETYQGWIEKVISLLAAQITGEFHLSKKKDLSILRHEALNECIRIETEIIRLKKLAEKEKQIPKLVNINLGIKELEKQLIRKKKKL